MVYFLEGQVLMPSGTYKGQKLIRLVRMNTTASAIRTMPHVPLTVSVKKRVAKIAANINRIIRSAEPMFVFIA